MPHLIILALLTSLVLVSAKEGVKVQKGTVTVQPVGSQTVAGTVTFEDTEDGVKISGSFTGLSEGLHGVTIHAIGDISQADCSQVGEHFNPHGKTHGDRTSAKSARHVGDLGNIKAGSDGKAGLSFTDDVISLNGVDHIIGKALVVHEKADDLGKGTGDDAEESKKTGNVGDPLACGVIGVTREKSGSSSVFAGVGFSLALIAAAIFHLM